MAPQRKKREPPDPLKSVILTKSELCLSLPSICSARSGVHSPYCALICSSLGRYSNLLRSRLLIRTLRVLTLKPVLASIVDVIAHLGFVGVPLGSSKAVLMVSPVWQLPSVSPQFRLLFFRSAPQVRFLPIFFSPLWVICCFGSYLLDRRSKPTLNHIGYWLIQILSYFPFAGC